MNTRKKILRLSARLAASPLLTLLVCFGAARPCLATCSWLGPGSTLYTNPSACFVGIGTTSPVVFLDVATASNFHFGAFNSTPGAASIGAFNDGFTSWKPLSINPGGQVWFLGGNIGIGKTAPNTTLDVNGSIAVLSSGSSLSAGSQLRTWDSSDNNWGISNTSQAGAGGDEFHLRVHGYGSPGSGNKRQFQVIDSATGNTVRFSVSFETGDVFVGGKLAAKYQDLAEWVPSGYALAPGTLVVLDAHRAMGVAPSAAAYDTAVAGVVSAAPGVILGEPGAGKSMVATTGRVRVKADATPGRINVGDLLVTSDREGHAMRSEPIDLAGTRIHRPGTIVGKALEPLESGQGEILILLSLQ